MQYFWYIIAFVNLFAYLVMSLDKIKSIYQWWRISEKTLWILALFGGVFGIWLGMMWPMYHKAGKKNFRIGIPIIAAVWIILILYLLLM